MRLDWRGGLTLALFTLLAFGGMYAANLLAQYDTRDYVITVQSHGWTGPYEDTYYADRILWHRSDGDVVEFAFIERATGRRLTVRTRAEKMEIYDIPEVKQ